MCSPHAWRGGAARGNFGVEPTEDCFPMRDMRPMLDAIPFPALTRGRLETLQINVGYRCNQSCFHCHVNAGPNRTEEMSGAVVDTVLAFLKRHRTPTLDITGGAPELNPHFRRLVREAGALGVHVMDRSNLTILEEPGQEDLADFLAANAVEVVASMPCYLEENVNNQRGKGVFDGSLKGLRTLNARGYGRDPALKLNLVYNPQGPSLPPPQASLEADYKRVLGEQYGIVFDQLYVLANMPIQRFGSALVTKGEFDGYLQLLQDAHLDANLDGVMCRSLLSVDYQGYVYDCDFNQMLDLPLAHGACERPHLSDLIDAELAGNPIRVAGHCYGCTAGQGSSCGGALKEAAE
jgi:radical SAM/Cys-rich protein